MWNYRLNGETPEDGYLIEDEEHIIGLVDEEADAKLICEAVNHWQQSKPGRPDEVTHG